MQEQEHPLMKWFGERRIVRLMLLAALLALGVIHIELIISTVLLLWRVASPLILGAVIAYILEIIIKRLEKVVVPHTKNRWLDKSRRSICILLAFVLLMSFLVLMLYTVIPGKKHTAKESADIGCILFIGKLGQPVHDDQIIIKFLCIIFREITL